MSKGITDADTYNFELSDELREMVKTELRETDATRSFAINAIREWIQTNPRIASVRVGEC